MKKLPKTVWIVRVDDRGGEFFRAAEDIDSFDDGEVVGEYTLTSLNKKRVLHQLDQQTNKVKNP